MTAQLGDRLTYTVAEAAVVIGIGRSLAYELVRSGELPTVQLGRRRVVPRRLLKAWLESRVGLPNLADTKGLSASDDIRRTHA